jgi:pilus assembly protein Flp/PilA
MAVGRSLEKDGGSLMSKALKLLNQVRKDEEGAALIEYTILLGIIAVAVIGFATTISGWINTQWSTLCGKLTGASC